MGEESRILIVNNKQSDHDSLQELLVSEGYDPQFMETEQQVFDYLNEKADPDVILVDVTIPTIDGVELCRKIKGQQQWQHIPLIMLIAPDNEEDPVRGLDVGVDEFLRKPVTEGELKTRIRSMVRLKKYHDKSQIALHSGKQSNNVNDEKQMLGSFTHEMSNTVSSNMLILNTVLEDEITLCHKNAEFLNHVFDLIEGDIPKEKRDKVLDYFQKIEENERTLDDVLRILTNSNDRAVDVTRLVLEYSRLGRFKFTKEPIRLKIILEEVIRKHQKTFAGQNISVRLTGSVPSTVSGHTSHFHLMFSNIILNACQALAELEETRERFIEIRLAEAEGRQIVTIRDNADGIPAKHFQKIFDPFYSTKPKTRIGLGLSFVSKLVAMYEGTVDVESKPGKGTLVTLTFPVQKFNSPPGRG